MQRKAKHNQTNRIVNLKDLFKCVRTVDSVEYVLGYDDECKEIVKISVEDLNTLLTDIGE